MTQQIDFEGLLKGFRAAGGWYDERVFGLKDYESMGGGAVALADMEADAPLFHIPNEILLTPYSSDVKSRLTDEEWEGLGDGWAKLILAMMWEESKGESSSWHYYLANMPREFDTPMFWTQEQLAELKGTDIEGRIGHEDAENEYQQRLLPVLQAHPDIFPSDSPHFSLPAFHMQGSRILSRSFTIPLHTALHPNEPIDDPEDSDDEDEAPEIAVMVPMADMLNAIYLANNANLTHGSAHTDEASGLPAGSKPGFTMVSTTEIKQGEQIINTYASPPNSELLRKYGHVDVFPLDQLEEMAELLTGEEIGGWAFGNEGDEVGLNGDLLAEAVKEVRGLSDEEVTKRVDRWLEEGHEDTFYLTYSDSLDSEFIAFIRILLFDEEWAKFEKKGKLPKGAIDGTVQRVLQLAINDRLGWYESDLETDLEVLVKSTFKDERQRRATIVRVGEKRLLELALRVAAEAAEVVEGAKGKRAGEGDSQVKKKART